MQKNPTVQELINKAGSITALAEVLGCSRAIIHRWEKNQGMKLQQPWLDALRYRKPEWFLGVA